MVRIEEKIFPIRTSISDMSEVIRWIARNNTKPGRNPAGENIVIHASRRMEPRGEKMPIPKQLPKSFGVRSATFWACRPFARRA